MVLRGLAGKRGVDSGLRRNDGWGGMGPRLRGGYGWGRGGFGRAAGVMVGGGGDTGGGARDMGEGAGDMGGGRGLLTSA